MGDWEYWAEQNELEHMFVDPDPHRRSLICYFDDEIEDEVWSWHPGHRVFGWLSSIRNELHIGADLFFAHAISVPEEANEPDPHAECDDRRMIGGVTYCVVDREKEARDDVIIMSRADEDRLRVAARHKSAAATTMKEEYFAEMMAEMAAFIHEHPTVESFVFAREI